MAFPVELWNFTKKTNSTRIPGDIGDTYQCISNDALNVLAPIVPLNIGASTNPTNYNYARINAFNRCYFITGWEFRGGLWYASMTVDVLASWKTDIGNQTLYVDRAASNWDGTIPDTLYPRTADFTVTKIPFTLTDSDQIPWKITGSVSDGNYILGIVGKGGVINYWAFNWQNYNTFMDVVFNYDYGFQDEALKASFNPVQYIISQVWVPFGITGPGTVPVEMGWWTIDGSNAHKLGGNTYRSFGATINLPKHPQQERGVWLNGGDTTRYILRLPCYGMLDIQGFDMLDAASITINVNVDLPTGRASCSIIPSSSDTATQIVDYQVGVNTPIAQLQSNILGQGLNTLRSSGGFGATIANAVVGAFQGVGALISGATNIADFDFSDKVTTSGSMGSLADCLISGMLIAVFQLVSDDNLPDRGRPYCGRIKLENLSGYMLISDADIEIPCTSTENDSIKRYMQTGFYYE